MRVSTIAQTVALAMLLNPSLGWPGMNKTLHDLLSGEASDTEANNGDSHGLLGDLATLPDSSLTPVGRSIKNILTGTGSGQDAASTARGATPRLGSAACRADTCCTWAHIAADMSNSFLGKAGRCNSLSRASIRLGFHDAAGWSKSTGGGGGADGSLILSGELSRPENNGLQEVCAFVTGLYNRYAPHHGNLTVADLIQMAATVATVTCPLGPRIRSFVGRRDSAVPAPPGLLPDVNSDADTLIRLFGDKTISPQGLAALIGAHSTSQQRFVDPARAGDPQDSSPGVWDTTYYRQTVGTAPPRVFRFPSDVNLAGDPRVAEEWGVYEGDQGRWNEDYAREYVRLSLLGVENINALTECTEVLPLARSAFVAPDQEVMDRWLNSTEHSEGVADAVFNGDLVVGLKRLWGS
ncbi:Peroxidase [Coniochaeta hoffmannii]|uniref:Peroxidase n=1 Tax=Coniochaeta hoffmannii TaxID=91930 RepID=A0AA38VJ09_9PEZI|nr:Peroxidase [Coniochaeta hoffmannii]